MYDTEKLIGIAKDHGLTHAHELNMKALIFMPEIKAMCNAERCEHYGKSWSCPPAVGSVEEIAKKVRDYSFGLLVQTVGKMDDVFDFDAMQNTARQHQKNFFSLIKGLAGDLPRNFTHGGGHLFPLQEMHLSRRALPLSRRYDHRHGGLRPLGQQGLRTFGHALQLR